MFLKVVLFCSQGLGRIYRQVQWKFYYLNEGQIMGLSNEISFILIFLAVSQLWIKMLDWNLPMRYNMSVSVYIFETLIGWEIKEYIQFVQKCTYSQRQNFITTWVFRFQTFELNCSWILSQLSYERVLYIKSCV